MNGLINYLTLKLLTTLVSDFWLFVVNLRGFQGGGVKCGRDPRSVILLIANAAIIFLGIWGSPQNSIKDITYSAKVRQMMAMEEGVKTMILVQAKR